MILNETFIRSARSCRGSLTAAAAGAVVGGIGN